MNFTLYLFFGLVALLFFLFVWSLRKSKDRSGHVSSAIPEGDFGQSHISYFPQIRQALAKTDYEFVSNRIPKKMRRQMRRERRRVALSYLLALREEFDWLLRMARVIAALSPQLAAVQEFERLRLTVNFQWRYRLLWMSLWAGLASPPQMNNLGNLLSGYSVRLEAAMKELGERAAIVAEMLSSPDRRGIHPV